MSITCKDAGYNCSHVIKGNTEEEVMQKAGRHAEEAHGLKQSDMTPDVTNKIKSLIKQVWIN